MTRLETLEPRTLMASDLSTGLDATFGRHGSLNFLAATNTRPDGTVAVSGSAIYIDARAGRQHYVYKIASNGKIDTAWGAGGRVTFGKIDVTQMAVDAKTGALYLAGVDNRQLLVQRFTAAGKEDAAFGANSVFSFTPTLPTVLLPNTADSYVDGIGALTPLAHQQLLVTFNRHTYVNHDTTGLYDNSTGEDELIVMRLRTGGTRDGTFGKNGLTTVFNGDFTSSLTEFSNGESSNRPVFGGIQLNSSGGVRIVASQQALSESGPNAGSTETTTSGAYQLVSRAINSAGKPEADPRVDLLVGGTSTDQRRIQPFYAGPVADDEFSVNIQTGAGGTGNDIGKITRFFSIGGDNPPSNTTLPVGDPAALTQFIRTASGDYFALTSSRKGTARYVTKLTDALTLNSKWGTGGTSFVAGVSDSTIFFGDASGRLLVIDDAGIIRRFDGIA